SRSGTSTPNTWSPKTSLGFGHGTAVEMRTFMYDTRKHEKMNVSLTRKIHIIALPHGTWKVCLSADQSETMLRQPSGRSRPIAVTPSCAIGLISSAAAVRRTRSRRQQQPEESEPDQQQEMPVRRAE